MSDLAPILAALSEPFGEGEVKFRAGTVSGNRAQALAYVDARAVAARLDSAVGAANWQDAYDFLPDGTVVCTLKVRLDGEWIAKQDVGKASKQPDAGDKVKAAVSDAFKRAAVKWGVGRHLYGLPRRWVDYDPQTKQLKGVPALPAAKPAKVAKAPQRDPADRKAVAAFASDLAQTENYLVPAGLSQAGEAERLVLSHLRLNGLSALTGEYVTEARGVLNQMIRARLLEGVKGQMRRTDLTWEDADRLLELAEGTVSERKAGLAQLKALYEALKNVPTPDPEAVGAGA